MSTVPGIAQLRGICQPAGLDVCLYRRIFTRRVSIYLTYVFLRIGISANSVSVLKGLLAAAGALLFTPGKPVLMAGGALLLQLSFILDACDGEVARFKGSNLRAGGEFIDKIGDAGSRGLFYGAWGWAVWNLNGDMKAAMAGTIMAGVWLVLRFCAVETLLESFSNHPGKEPEPDELRSLEMLFVRNPNQGKIEYFLSSAWHPWVNVAAVAAVLSFFPDAFHCFFWVYFILWSINSVRKARSGFRISNFRRPAL